MRLLRIENGHYCALSSFWKKKTAPKIRIRTDRTETLRLLEGLMSYLHQQVRKAKEMRCRTFAKDPV